MKELIADFETCTFEGRERVWLWGVREVSKDINANVEIGNSIESFFDYCNNLKTGKNIFFHNLKFDGDFIVYYLLETGHEWKNLNQRKLKAGEFSTNVSFMGVVYSIVFKNKFGKVITFRDSLKLFTNSEANLAKDYNLPTVKGSIDYKKERSPEYEPTQEEIEYIKNDVYIIAHILFEFREAGYKKYTTASSALYEFITTCFPMKDGTINFKISYDMFKERHPLTLEQDKQIRNAYRGGYCYVNPKYKGCEIGEGCVFDVNSMYPSVMYDELMPCGAPLYQKGTPFYNKYYCLFITHIIVDFKLKEGCFPMIQNKGRVIPTLNSRDYIEDTHGHKIDIWLTSVDLDLFFKCYEVFSIEYIEGYSFKAKKGGYFRPYIDRFIQLKNEGKKEGNASKKNFGKLFLNSLYGKMGAKTENFVMKPTINEKGWLCYRPYEQTENEPIYIPLACFITSYARQKLFNCILNNGERFLYSDTDSVHLIGTEDAEGIEIDKTKLGAWDKELIFDRAKYLGCKTYIEESFEKGLTVHCAGLSSSSLSDVTFENFEYDSAFAIKKCKSTTGGKIIENTTFKIKKR